MSNIKSHTRRNKSGKVSRVKAFVKKHKVAVGISAGLAASGLAGLGFLVSRRGTSKVASAAKKAGGIVVTSSKPGKVLSDKLLAQKAKAERRAELIQALPAYKHYGKYKKASEAILVKEGREIKKKLNNLLSMNYTPKHKQRIRDRYAEQMRESAKAHKERLANARQEFGNSIQDLRSRLGSNFKTVYEIIDL